MDEYRKKFDNQFDERALEEVKTDSEYLSLLEQIHLLDKFTNELHEEVIYKIGDFKDRDKDFEDFKVSLDDNDKAFDEISYMIKNSEYMIKDWVNWKWLSGDHIVEQHVHNIDVFTWFSGLKPIKAVAFGSRQRRITGDQFDNFSVDFTMENGVHLHSMCRQIDGCANNVSEFIQGTKGSWNSSGQVIKDLAGNVIYQPDSEHTITMIELLKDLENQYNKNIKIESEE